MIQRIREIAESYREFFLWTPDQETFNAMDFWSSLKQEFEAVLEADRGNFEPMEAVIDKNRGGQFEKVLQEGQLHVRGDCDNFAWSVIDKVMEEGLLPPECVYAYGVGPQIKVFPGVVDHMIAVFEIDGERYAADNASRRPFYKLTDGPHYNYVQFVRMDDPREWRYE